MHCAWCEGSLASQNMSNARIPRRACQARTAKHASHRTARHSRLHGAARPRDATRKIAEADRIRRQRQRVAVHEHRNAQVRCTRRPPRAVTGHTGHTGSTATAATCVTCLPNSAGHSSLLVMCARPMSSAAGRLLGRRDHVRKVVAVPPSAAAAARTSRSAASDTCRPSMS
jgi:hypothetical protein